MCGIAGFLGQQCLVPENSQEILQKMTKVQQHRGPDDAGQYVSSHCALCFQRLAIIDIEHGQQPMHSSCGRYTIVFNGEIYNFHQLRNELQDCGVVFQTASDTEVLLMGYAHWKHKILDKIRGMFAFAIYDTQNHELFLARDHTGIKPLYFCQYQDYFIFASEIKTLLQFPGVPRKINENAIAKYMSFLWVPAPETLFSGIYALEPGHMMRVTQSQQSKQRYWTPDLWSQDRQLSFTQWKQMVDTELQRSVTEQMMSDVPLGAFLSGGVDSSLIIAYMNRISQQKITTYTTGFPRHDLANDVISSDVEYARIAAQHLNVEYNELILSPDIEDLLPKLVWHMDEPAADPAAITTFLICQQAKKKATVMLSGVGGDEIFAGYPRYLANLIAEKYLKIPRILRKSTLEWWLKKFPAGRNAFFRNARKFLKSVEFDFRERYFGYLTYYSQHELRRLLKVDFEWNEVFALHTQVMQQHHDNNPIQAMMNVDLQTFLPYLNLAYTDKMSSASSVEVRVPFLDHVLIEKAAQIPPHWKIHWGNRKYLLKKVAQNYLPKEIVWRKKAGFGAPIGAWIKGALKEMMLDLLSEETINKRGIFHYPQIKTIIDDHLQGKSYNANQLWQLINFEIWFQKFIDE